MTQAGLRKLAVHILKPNLRPNLPGSNYERKVCLRVFARVQDDTLIILPNLGSGEVGVLVPRQMDRRFIKFTQHFWMPGTDSERRWQVESKTRVEKMPLRLLT